MMRLSKYDFVATDDVDRIYKLHGVQFIRSNLVVSLLITLIVLGHSQSANSIGGQFGLEFAIDAPWRLEPISLPGGGYTYGPIPIVVTFDDAIFDDERGVKARAVLGQIHVGTIEEIHVVERGESADNNPLSVVPLSQLREIERKRWISTKDGEPAHELCRPYRGEDCQALHLINDSHEWHAMFWFTPQTPMKPGVNVQLEVTVVTDYNGSKREFTNYLVVHAGDAPLPRFGNAWLYGDLHYHSQMTDNEGESGYSYRNVVRALGAMGLDFVFATDHASGGEQLVDGGITVSRCGSPAGAKCAVGFPAANDVCQLLNQGRCREFEGTEARDLNSTRFAAAKLILYGADGANEAIAHDAETGGIANLRSRGYLPQVFMGEEVDAWPEMSAEEQRQGLIRFGDGLQYNWPNPNNCVAEKGLDVCREMYSKLYADRDHRSFLVLDEQGVPIEETIESVLGDRHLEFVGLEFGSEGLASLVNYFAPDGTKPFGSRQHLVYLPFSASGGTPDIRDHQGWIPSNTSDFGGATRRLEEVVRAIEPKGVAFLAHPLIGHSPGGPGPDMVPYSRFALDRAWKSPAIVGLQLWNEDDRFVSGPTRREPAVMFTDDNKYAYNLPWDRYSPNSSAWKWKLGTVRTAQHVATDLYHGGFTWDLYLRKGLDPSQTRLLTWLPQGEPRKWFMAGGSDSHGDFNFRRYGRPCDGQWCDAPVGDSAIGKPRNLVLVGPPQGTPAPKLQNVKRHTNLQVIDALREGRFSVTDGPAIRIAIDKNRNGRIDSDDFQMGSTFNFFPGEHIPLLIEWMSSPEFGPVTQVDVYVGNTLHTFAPKKHGPILPLGQNRNTEFGSYEPDPSGVLKVKLVEDYYVSTAGGGRGGKILAGTSPSTPFHGIARVFLGPDQFGLAKSDQALFYVRAFASTASALLDTDEFIFACPSEASPGNSCGEWRWAYSNPIWGRYRTSCQSKQLPQLGAQPVAPPLSVFSASLDGDNNNIPDTCERVIPNPCTAPPLVGGGIVVNPPELAILGGGDSPGVAVNPGRAAADLQPLKPVPSNSCQFVKPLLSLLPGNDAMAHGEN